MYRQVPFQEQNEWGNGFIYFSFLDLCNILLKLGTSDSGGIEYRL